jgi:hypothetical protein
MSIIKLIRKVEERVTWSFVSIVLAILFFGVSIFFFLYEPKPNVTFEVLNEANVLDIHKPLRDLSIFFQGNDIQRKKLNLRIFTIRIENSGKVNILQNNYDQNDIWGFQVVGAKIIEVRLLNSNDSYIESNLNPHIYNGDIVRFKKIVFDRGKFFTLEVLVLHEKDKLPNIIPLGKIAGIDKITPIKSWIEKERKTFWTELLYGSLVVHIVRFPVYFVLLVIFSLAIGLPLAGISSLLEGRKKKLRRKMAEEILGKEALEGRGKIITENYVSDGLEKLKDLKALLEDQRKLAKKVKKYEKAKEIEKNLLEFKAIDPRSQDVVDVPDWYMDMMLREGRYKSYKDLPQFDFVEEGILKVGKGNKVVVDSKFKSALDKFIVELEARNKETR